MDKKQYSKLTRILEFYKTEKDEIKSHVMLQASKVIEAQQTVKLIQEGQEQAFTKWAEIDATVGNRLVGAVSVAHSQVELELQIQQTKEEEEELAARKLLLREKMAQIESMEKLLDRKSAAIQYEEQRKEQLAVDERFLNTKSNGIEK